MKRDPLPPIIPVTLADLEIIASRASGVVDALRNQMLLPDATKKPPMLSGDQVASLCDLTKGKMAYRVKSGAPAGQVAMRGSRREFSVEEAQAWSRIERKDKLRPEGAKAITIGVAFFKGGVTKTTSTMVLAQGLSLLGHRVLSIDLDPQGSLSTLHGLIPEEIEEDLTLGPLFQGIQTDVRYAIQKTYWPNIDLIPSSASLFAAEFYLPTRQINNRGFQFWNVLNLALDAVRDEYDVILIDTPPALSYMTINAFFAADGMIIPMTPNMLDVASSAQFWNLFLDLASKISENQATPKTYDFVNVLLSRVNNQESTTRVVREWIHQVYGAKVLPVEIPVTTVASAKVNEFATAYDVTRYEGDSRTYKRAREAYEALALTVEDLIRRCWDKQLLTAKGGV